MNKKVTSIVLAVCVLLSCIAVGSFSATAGTADVAVSAQADDETVGADYGLAKNIEDGQILQAWNWSYNGIKNNMKKIAEQGFTAVQTTPIQTIKESTQGKTMQGSWWVYYQPSNFKIDTNGSNALGTKSDFTAMCAEAHKYGVKVVVDAVLNHMANAGDNTLSNTIPDDIRNDSNCWHSITQNTQNYNDRWDVTHNCMGGLPDLNTGNKKIQNYEIAFMKECIDAGVDGFRFDGAKHIEVPDDDKGAGSDFWPTLLGATDSYARSTKGFKPYYYGEVLDATGGGQNITNKYTQYMSLTCNGVSNDIRNKVNSGDANGAKRTDFSYSDGGAPSGKKAVLWNESHDTYADGASRGQSDTTLKKTWAIVGARAEAQAMYMARPRNYGDSIGTASVTAWGDPEVAAVNHFKNYFVGKSEYMSSSGSIVYNERGTEGVVLVNLNGGSTSVNVKANKMKDGTYTDEVTGGTFRVSGGQISGNIGGTGVAVVYNAKPAGPSASVTPGSSKYKTDSITLTLSYDNATSGQYSIDGGAYQSYTKGQTITIGAGKPVGTQTTVSVKASDGSTTSDPETYTYTKSDNSAQMVYFDNSSYNWSSVYAYIYADKTEAAAWPGTQMQKDSTGYFALEVPEGFEDGLVIFTESKDATDHRYPADKDPGLPLEGKSKIFKANHQLVDYDNPVPTTPQPTTAPVGNVLIGDTNGDGNITVTDATLIQMHAASMQLLTGDRLTAADTNKDGSVNIADATMVQLYLVFNRSASNYTGTYTGGTTPTNPPQPTTSYVQPTTAYVPPTTAPPSGGVTLNASATSTGTEDWYAWTWSSDSDGHWVKGNGSASSVQFSGNIGKSIIFVRLPQGESPSVDWGNIWNQTNDLTTKLGGTFKTTGWADKYMNGEWQ
ncbi:alpha-amylase family glycosyl hydrolase [Lachnoclostridium sp. MSJ-17]|uniref:alpha-amylase family glycosyl hydrolase n=1 Tax=Lachnoclostridium sp. MSJ-17 TaxID=2841516 RepID=UPI001C0FE471|nr:alpha-amylase family glycosyl hydrolase [Lachnoclostridium sp. MSJ-17]MBU5463028.1 starch-binding protein [Lachnoclostridium sp. MSJ-17]